MGSPPLSAQQQSSTNPFAASPASTGSNLLGSPTTAEPVKASDDLLSLTGNPFVENVQQVMAMNATVSTMNAQPQFATPAWNNTPSTNNVTGLYVIVINQVGRGGEGLIVLYVRSKSSIYQF